MKKLLSVLCFFAYSSLHAQNGGLSMYRQDFDYFWTTINDNYCYWEKKETDWQKVKAIYQPLSDTITSKASFISLLEKVFYELYDHHASLNNNTAQSQRLVPSGTDLWAEFISGKPIITEVKPGSGAENAGIRPGMQVIAVNGVAVEKAMEAFLPKCLKQADEEAKNFALRLLLAGNHSEKRKISLREQNRELNFSPDEPVNLLEISPAKPAVETKIFEGNIGYILINNELGEGGLVKEFDSAISTLANTKAIVLDMRNTPSGGTTTVARSILGHFISKEGFFQKHELAAEEKETGVKRSWVEIVSPRKPFYGKQLAILADHWTGSVGEGIVIGFDALKRGKIIGTEMAQLNGAVYSFQMPNTGIGFSFPAEKLFHVNGIPREDFHPAIEVNLASKKKSTDPILHQALDYLTKNPGAILQRH